MPLPREEVRPQEPSKPAQKRNRPGATCVDHRGGVRLAGSKGCQGSYPAAPKYTSALPSTDPHPLVEAAKQRYVAGEIEIEELEFQVASLLEDADPDQLERLRRYQQAIHVRIEDNRRKIRERFEETAWELKRFQMEQR
jgi:hypothetical protein